MATVFMGWIEFTAISLLHSFTGRNVQSCLALVRRRLRRGAGFATLLESQKKLLTKINSSICSAQ
jgi:hypothetical protein